MEKNGNIRKKFKVFRALIICAACLFVAIMLVLFSGKMEETVFAHGVIEGMEKHELRSMMDAKIISVKKKEGEYVKKGDLLIEFDSRELCDQIEILKSSVLELEAEIAAKSDSLIVLRNDPLPTHYRHAKIALNESLKIYRKAKEKLNIYKGLREKRVISKVKMDEIEGEYFTSSANLEKAMKDNERVKSGLGEKIMKQAESEEHLMRVKLLGKKKRLKLLEQHLSDYRLVAPEDGMITYMPYNSGRYLEAGDVIARLSSVKQKKLVAYVDERQIFKVKMGQAARIVSHSYNHFNFGYFYGKVMQIAELPVRKSNSFCYPVEVLITEEPYGLKLGSSAEIMIVTGQDRIISVLLGLDK